MAGRPWTCKKCKETGIPRRKHLCPECGWRRPARRKPAHQLVLEFPYEVWAERFGETCGICGRPPGPKRNLDRDHDHKTGEPRGLLCHRCNRALPDWMTVEWLEAAVEYLRRPRSRFDERSTDE